MSSDEEDSSVQGGKDLKRSTYNWYLGKLGVKMPIGTFQLEVATFQIRTSNCFRSYILDPGILPHEAAFNFYRLQNSSDGNRAERLGTSVRTTSYSPVCYWFFAMICKGGAVFLQLSGVICGQQLINMILWAK